MSPNTTWAPPAGTAPAPDIAALNKTAGDAIATYVRSQGLNADNLQISFDRASHTVTASGQAAEFLTFASLVESGDHVVSAAGLYGGTVTQLDGTLRRFGVSTTFVPEDDVVGLERLTAHGIDCGLEVLPTPIIERADHHRERPHRRGVRRFQRADRPQLHVQAASLRGEQQVGVQRDDGDQHAVGSSVGPHFVAEQPDQSCPHLDGQ